MDWSVFFVASAGRPVRPLLPQVLAAYAPDRPGASRRAVDLGCGDGTETRHLLARGWHVHAYDGAAGTEERVRAGVRASDLPRLQATRAAFEEIHDLPACDLVYAGHSLPFCARSAFPALWAQVTAAIVPGGLFVGDFFGPHDSWRDDEAMNFHGRAELPGLLSGFEVLDVAEAEGPAATPFGAKHLHMLTVVARRS